MTPNRHSYLTGIDGAAPLTADRLGQLEAALREDYIQGRIEVDEFEERIGRILAGDPMTKDLLRPPELRFGPGVAIPVSDDPRSILYPLPLA